MDTRSDPKKVKSTQSKLTSVQIIQSNNDLVLVEWTNEHGILQRSWVEQSALVDAAGRTAKVEDPGQGVPYGVEFWRIVKLSLSSKDLDRELKQRGIWTLADLRTRPNEVLGALVAAHGVDLAAVFQAADRYEKELKKET